MAKQLARVQEHAHSARRRAAAATIARTGVRGWLAGGLIAIGAGLATVALLGPLATAAIEYHVTS